MYITDETDTIFSQVALQHVQLSYQGCRHQKSLKAITIVRLTIEKARMLDTNHRGGKGRHCVPYFTLICLAVAVNSSSVDESFC